MTWSPARLLQSSTAFYSTEHMLPAGCTLSFSASHHAGTGHHPESQH